MGTDEITDFRTTIIRKQIPPFEFKFLTSSTTTFMKKIWEGYSLLAMDNQEKNSLF